MKAPAPFSGSRPEAPTASRAAFTLPELLITITLFVLLVGAILCAHLFGLRMSGLTEAKLIASASARQALGKMAEEIRNCTSTSVGDVTTNGVFVELLDGVPQTGSALLVQPTTNDTDFVVYFVNPADQSFRRTTSVPGTTTIVARSVTNAAAFRAQDYQGNLLTNNQANHVIHLTLEFYQPQPYLPVPDYYKLETSVTGRALEQ
jgi:prepilin-type N-terminal cleavage/methylation domain-containing protein